MKITPTDLEPNGYVLLAQLEHSDLLRFLNEKSGRKGLFMQIFLVCLVLPIPLISYRLTFSILTDEISIFQAVFYSLLGVGLVFVFIPVHELLHALALKIIGAQNISFFSNFKQFYFATISDKAILNLREFQLVALFPFLTVWVIAFIVFAFLPLHWSFTLLCFVATHNFFCSGDFALLNYMQKYKHQGILTFDDKEAKATYFYIKKS